MKDLQFSMYLRTSILYEWPTALALREFTWQCIWLTRSQSLMSWMLLYSVARLFSPERDLTSSAYNWGEERGRLMLISNFCVQTYSLALVTVQSLLEKVKLGWKLKAILSININVRCKLQMIDFQVKLDFSNVYARETRTLRDKNITTPLKSHCQGHQWHVAKSSRQFSVLFSDLLSTASDSWFLPLETPSSFSFYWFLCCFPGHSCAAFASLSFTGWDSDRGKLLSVYI